MRYRILSPTGDFTFAQGPSNFLIDSPSAVGQAVRTRLLLLRGEWFLDITEGTPYSTEILGKGTTPTYDQAIRQRILETQGVTGIVSYSSALNRSTRALTVTATITTVYGETTVSAVL